MIRKRFVILAVAAAIAVLALPGGGAVAQGPVMVAAPGSYLTPTYGQPGIVVQSGGELTFTNLDIQRHDVVAVPKPGQYAPVQCTGENQCPPGTPSWCLPVAGVMPFPPGFCPIVWSELIPLGASTPVLGLEYLTTGQVIEFLCTIHRPMRAYLVAV